MMTIIGEAIVVYQNLGPRTKSTARTRGRTLLLVQRLPLLHALFCIVTKASMARFRALRLSPMPPMQTFS